MQSIQGNSEHLFCSLANWIQHQPINLHQKKMLEMISELSNLYEVPASQFEELEEEDLKFLLKAIK